MAVLVTRQRVLVAMIVYVAGRRIGGRGRFSTRGGWRGGECLIVLGRGLPLSERGLIGPCHLMVVRVDGAEGRRSLGLLDAATEMACPVLGRPVYHARHQISELL